MKTATLSPQQLTPQIRDIMIAEIMEHEEMCAACSDESLNQIEKRLRLMDNTSLTFEYKNYFPGA